jgi:hypothetical protein
LLRRQLFCVEQAGENQVYVTVPEAGGDGQARAINDGRTARYFYGDTRPNGGYAAIVDED